MSFWDFRRSAASVRILVEFGRERGLASERLLRGSGVSLRQLDDPNIELAAAQELRVTANLLRLLEAPAHLGLDLGLRYHYSAYGLWGYGLISSATAADALKLALRFLPLTYAYTLIAYHEERGLGVLGFGEPPFEDELRRFVVERDMAAAALLIHELAGPQFRLKRFCLLAPAPRHARVRRLFGAELCYGARTNELSFELAALSRALPDANPITAAMCHQLCADLLERRRAPLSTADAVRRYLEAPGIRLPDLKTMALQLNLSERTLKRRLQLEGSSFRVLLAERRRARAAELLRDPALSLGQIAEQLGFADLSSFSQAHKRWHGVAPAKLRQSTRQPLRQPLRAPRGHKAAR